MPTPLKPRCLHVLCDDAVYEQSVFSQLQTETTLQHLTTGAKQTLTIPSDNISFCPRLDITTYLSCNLHVLGDFKCLYDDTNQNKIYPKLQYAIHPVDIK